MGPINNLARGLLTRFGLQTLGRYPTLASDAISHVVDTKDLLNFNLHEKMIWQLTQVGAGTITAGFNQCDIAQPVRQVPANELWHVLRAIVIVSPFNNVGNVGGNIFPSWLEPGIGIQSVPDCTKLFSADTWAGLAVNQRSLVMCSAKDFFIPGGANLGFQLCDAVTAAAGQISIFGDIEFVRLRS